MDVFYNFYFYENFIIFCLSRETKTGLFGFRTRHSPMEMIWPSIMVEKKSENLIFGNIICNSCQTHIFFFKYILEDNEL